jgi:uncharacterized protein YcbK (DUF882 family)
MRKFFNQNDQISLGGSLRASEPSGGVASSNFELPSLPNRRDLLRAAALMPAMLTGMSAWAQEGAYHPQDFWSQPRSIWMKRPATREEIRVTYWADGQLLRDGYFRLCWFMRDVQMQAQIEKMQSLGQPIPRGMVSNAAQSPILLDILYATGGWLEYHGIGRALILNSGFRHPITNGKTEGAAMASHHTRAGAGDIVVPGVDTASVSAYGRWLSGGGVGWYPGKSFTHVDDGRLRFWRG